MQCSDTGIQLGGSSYYTSDTVLARNFIFGTGMAGISVTGFAFPELEISRQHDHAPERRRHRCRYRRGSHCR